MLTHSLGIWTHLPTHPPTRHIYMLDCRRLFCMELFANCWFLLKILLFLKEEPWRWKIDNFNKCYKLQDYSSSSCSSTTTMTKLMVISLKVNQTDLCIQDLITCTLVGHIEWVQGPVLLKQVLKKPKPFEQCWVQGFFLFQFCIVIIVATIHKRKEPNLGAIGQRGQKDIF